MCGSVSSKSSTFFIFFLTSSARNTTQHNAQDYMTGKAKKKKKSSSVVFWPCYCETGGSEQPVLTLNAHKKTMQKPTCILSVFGFYKFKYTSNKLACMQTNTTQFVLLKNTNAHRCIFKNCDLCILMWLIFFYLTLNVENDLVIFTILYRTGEQLKSTFVFVKVVQAGIQRMLLWWSSKALVTMFMFDVCLKTVSTLELLLYREAIV